MGRSQNDPPVALLRLYCTCDACYEARGWMTDIVVEVHEDGTKVIRAESPNKGQPFHFQFNAQAIAILTTFLTANLSQEKCQ